MERWLFFELQNNLTFQNQRFMTWWERNRWSYSIKTTRHINKPANEVNQEVLQTRQPLERKAREAINNLRNPPNRTRRRPKNSLLFRRIIYSSFFDIICTETFETALRTITQLLVICSNLFQFSSLLSASSSSPKMLQSFIRLRKTSRAPADSTTYGLSTLWKSQSMKWSRIWMVCSI